MRIKQRRRKLQTCPARVAVTAAGTKQSVSSRYHRVTDHRWVYESQLKVEVTGHRRLQPQRHLGRLVRAGWRGTFCTANNEVGLVVAMQNLGRLSKTISQMIVAADYQTALW